MNPVDTLVCDTQHLATWHGDASYDYGRELAMQPPGIMDWILGRLKEWFNALFDNQLSSDMIHLLVVCIGFLVIAAVGWFLYKKRPDLFGRRAAEAPLGYEVEEDTIYGIDFERRIAEAVGQTDYREASRLCYLATLKALSDSGRIDWQLFKTPTQYTTEVASTDFRELTTHFLRVRYGNFEATEALFLRMSTLRGAVERGGIA